MDEELDSVHRCLSVIALFSVALSCAGAWSPSYAPATAADYAFAPIPARQIVTAAPSAAGKAMSGFMADEVAEVSVATVKQMPITGAPFSGPFIRQESVAWIREAMAERTAVASQGWWNPGLHVQTAANLLDKGTWTSPGDLTFGGRYIAGVPSRTNEWEEIPFNAINAAYLMEGVNQAVTGAVYTACARMATPTNGVPAALGEAISNFSSGWVIQNLTIPAIGECTISHSESVRGDECDLEIDDAGVNIQETTRRPIMDASNYTYTAAWEMSVETFDNNKCFAFWDDWDEDNDAWQTFDTQRQLGAQTPGYTITESAGGGIGQIRVDGLVASNLLAGAGGFTRASTALVVFDLWLNEHHRTEYLARGQAVAQATSNRFAIAIQGDVAVADNAVTITLSSDPYALARAKAMDWFYQHQPPECVFDGTEWSAAVADAAALPTGVYEVQRRAASVSVYSTRSAVLSNDPKAYIKLNFRMK